MSLIVQKYGGSSLADAAKIKNVARRIAKTRKAGNKVVVVVSAMGDTTDDLIKLAFQVNKDPEERELDVLLSTGELVASTLLAMALHGMGQHSISLSGAQAGIRTDDAYSMARITDIDPSRILKELNKGNIVIVAGFQGINKDSDTTTLGRGGSDTTAVALAAALKAERCERYTDVDGIYSTDPRLLPKARKLRDISYDEMLEMVSYGSKAVQPRAVELAEVYNIPFLVASSFNSNPGTLIHKEVSMEIVNKVRSIAYDLDVAKITILGVPDKPGVAAKIFVPLAKAGVSVDTIVQNASVKNITDLTFTVAKSDLEAAMKVVQPIAKAVGARQCIGDPQWGKVSIVGSGMQNTPGYAARMFDTLSKAGVNIQLITTSEIRITCIIERVKVKEAVTVLHQAFELDKKN
ncbi:MAG: aspartate kinase [Dehalococcoidales bacterium]|nr:aspartate kinase [Dehalococcoidales bacterium]